MRCKATIETLIGALKTELLEFVPEDVLEKELLLKTINEPQAGGLDSVIINLPDRDETIRLNKLLDRIHTLRWVLDDEGPL